MPAKITATYDGAGSLEDPGSSDSPTGLIVAGVPFEVTQSRFDELVAQGIPVSKVTKPRKGDAPTVEAAS